MKPSDKDPGMWEAMKIIFGFDLRDRIEQGVCVPAPYGCGRENIEGGLRNELSRQEYSMSGLCQSCQDETFGPDHGNDFDPSIDPFI